MSSFKYLGRIITDTNDDLEAIDLQLKKARMTFGRIGKIIKKKTKGSPKTMAIFYKVIIQLVLLYGSELWVISKHAHKKLQRFHRRCARFITGRHITVVDEKWVYPDSKTTLEMADLLPIEEYIQKRKETVKIFTVDRKLYSDCKLSTYLTKNDRSLIWL